jgi:hypothetical protein
VTDGVFLPAADQAGSDAPPTFLPARPITQADLAALTERVRLADLVPPTSCPRSTSIDQIVPMDKVVSCALRYPSRGYRHAVV